ncbi:hypothetical protein Leryth_015860 [Lithospermum erythrorhizon]|nr:hypothetical protein Leryth_015860 [Lithospermum erythrorhizon]
MEDDIYTIYNVQINVQNYLYILVHICRIHKIIYIFLVHIDRMHKTIYFFF